MSDPALGMKMLATLNRVILAEPSASGGKAE